MVEKHRYDRVEEGTKYRKTYRVFCTDAASNEIRSFWHDVPLFPPLRSGTRQQPTPPALNFVCEIPSGTRAKMEVQTGESGTPIAQDTNKDGSMRFYGAPIPWNYGMLPRTWEDPRRAWEGLDAAGGDGDPLDVVEVSGARCEMGQVCPVHVLGAFALIDEGEVDWKIVVRRTDVSESGGLDPAEAARIHAWFRDYKLLEGKPQNRFGFDGRYLGPGFAMDVVREAHRQYRGRA